MKLKRLLSQLKFWWHSIRVHYHQALLDSCLDCRLQKKIQQKIMYHEMKLNNY
ncbi:hypothetical protein [Bacillus sp. Marseille-Q1617]|uniref:hypothetical protein n=1 Tax=Bacillus sp. Marseille-Q1617 TaxID=2736887 RepID=UPI00158E0D1E|nr:hypothetical protein [Bacillus sp. Marseille-Q1617]